jgi:hypothetical protein
MNYMDYVDDNAMFMFTPAPPRTTGWWSKSRRHLM